MIGIRKSDIRRATLPLGCGNEGWLGFSPDGTRYHVVVPVDVQIARGVMACNRPYDGTPFGGYTGWLYFRCEPFHEDQSQRAQVRENGDKLLKWLTSYQIVSELIDDLPCREDESGLSGAHSRGMAECSGHPARKNPEPFSSAAESCRVRHRRRLPGEPAAHCAACGKTWERVGEFVRDPLVKLRAYRVCTEDFRRGEYIFSHGCPGSLNIPVSRFASPRVGKSLIGSHGCPGLCYYETSLRACSAQCEGACYRRIAMRLAMKTDQK